MQGRMNEKKMQRLRKKRGGRFVEKKKQKTEEEAEIDMSEYCVLKCAALGAWLPQLICGSLMALCPRAGQNSLCGEQEQR